MRVQGTEGDTRFRGKLIAISGQQHPSIPASKYPSFPADEASRVVNVIFFSRFCNGFSLIIKVRGYV
jgi:hypothetical protein